MNPAEPFLIFARLALAGFLSGFLLALLAASVPVLASWQRTVRYYVVLIGYAGTCLSGFLLFVSVSSSVAKMGYGFLPTIAAVVVVVAIMTPLLMWLARRTVDREDIKLS